MLAVRARQNTDVAVIGCDSAAHDRSPWMIFTQRHNEADLTYVPFSPLF
jgi:hypothetical protein